eukprot:7657223-Heterocapsa_arctica.AAC.1
MEMSVVWPGPTGSTGTRSLSSSWHQRYGVRSWHGWSEGAQGRRSAASEMALVARPRLCGGP